MTCRTNVDALQLQAIADRVVAEAEPGEQVEAYVSRDSETDVRVYEGEVEHFVSAQSEGIGIRVIRDGRTGFAYAGTLDDAPIAEVLGRGARQRRVRHARRVGRPRRARRRRGRRRRSCGARRSPSTRPTRKIELAKELERLTLAADPRVRVDDANYADVAAESAVATTTGIRRTGRENGCYVSVSTLADDGDETQTGFGFSVGRSPDEFDLAKAAREASRPGDPPARRDEAAQPAHDRGARPVRHGAVPRRHLQHAERRERSPRAAACSRTASARRSPARSSRSSTTRPTRRPTPPPTSTAKGSRRGATC